MTQDTDPDPSSSPDDPSRFFALDAGWLQLELLCEAGGWQDADLSPAALATILAPVLANMPQDVPGLPARVEASLLLTDDAAVKAMNAEWRGLDKPTNILSFPAERQSGSLGDMVLAFETVMAEAVAQTKLPADHCCHLVIHGLLHLLGYGHEAAVEAETMERLESRILTKAGKADPYAEETAP